MVAGALFPLMERTPKIRRIPMYSWEGAAGASQRGQRIGEWV
jgi:hypothetical protein